MDKYLVLYTEEVSHNCSRYDVRRNEHFDDLDKAMTYITKLKAFGKEWDSEFLALLAVKEIPVDISEDKIEFLREEERLREKARKDAWKCEQEEDEKAELERLKEKYET